eukprot:g2532.t1
MANPFAEFLEVGEDGLTFSNKTAQWIAYERDVESQRPDRLFNDPIAKHLTGKYGKALSDVFSKYADAHYFPGLGENGFKLYHGARTKLISDYIGKWAGSVPNPQKKQIINLGAGYDTRAFWDNSLQDVDLYIEVDEGKVNEEKEKVLKSMSESLPKLICNRQMVSLNFATETILDLKKYDFFKASKPTCWILEGLIMYLEEDHVRNIYNVMDELSVPNSFAIINVVGNAKEHCKAEFAEKILCAKGWKKEKKILFGEDGFRYGRYLENAEVNKNLGFLFLRKG